MPDKGGLQLLPDTRKKIEVRTPGENRMLIFGFLSMLLVGGMYFGLTMYISGLSAEVSSLDSQLQALEEKRNKKAEQELVSLAKQANIIQDVVEDHTFFTGGFSRIEKILHPKVQLDSMLISADEKRISITLVAQSYVDLARQLSAFLSGDGIVDAEVGKVTADNDGRVRTSAILQVDGNKYFKK